MADVCTEFVMLKVKLTLPIIFLGIVGFSPLGRDVTVYTVIARFPPLSTSFS